MQSIEAKNSSIIDSMTERRSFVRSPNEIPLNIPETGGFAVGNSISIPRHPDGTVTGDRTWLIGSGKVLLEKEDVDIAKIRLKGFADVEIIDGIAKVSSIERSDRRTISHWLPIEMSREAILEVPTGNEIDIVTGAIENFDLSEGMIIQLERVGFAIIDEIPRDGAVVLRWLHR
jgi:hypothetical protein